MVLVPHAKSPAGDASLNQVSRFFVTHLSSLIIS